MTSVTLAVFFLGLVVIIIVSLYVASPLFGSDVAVRAGEEAGERERWERQKRQALAAIKEAELDHQLGKLTDDDLRAMRARFESQALEALAALERRGESR